MKKLTESQVDDLLKLKYGKLATAPGHRAYVSNKVLAKIFGVSQHVLAAAIRVRFERHRLKNLPLLQKLRPPPKSVVPYQHFEGRQRFGLKFLKEHHVKWITNEHTLKE